MKHNVYMEYGSIYNSHTGCIIEHPAILFDKDSAVVLSWGDAETVKAKLLSTASAYSKAGMDYAKDCLLMLEFNGFGLTREEQCYIMRRAVEHTATGFQKELCEHALKEDFREWLKNEMSKLPLDLTEKEWKMR